VEFFNIKSGGTYGDHWGLLRLCFYLGIFCVLFAIFVFVFTVLVSSYFPSDCYHSNLTPNSVTRYPLVSSWLTGESDLNSCQAQKVSTHILHSVQDRLCIVWILNAYSTKSYKWEAYGDFTNRTNMRHTNTNRLSLNMWRGALRHSGISFHHRVLPLGRDETCELSRRCCSRIWNAISHCPSWESAGRGWRWVLASGWLESLRGGHGGFRGFLNTQVRCCCC